MEDIMNRIDDLEREIAVLPQGNITVKNIKGKDYYYHRIINNKKEPKPISRLIKLKNCALK